MSELTSNPDVLRAIKARDEAHAAFNAGIDTEWKRVAHQLAIAQMYGSAGGRNAHEIRDEERALRLMRDAAWKDVVATNEALVLAQHRALCADIAAERRAAEARR